MQKHSHDHHDAQHEHEHEHEHEHGHGHGHGHDHAEAPAFLPHWMQHYWTVLTVGGAGVFLLLGFLGERFLHFPPSVAIACYIAAYVCGGIDVAREAVPAVFRGKFDTDLLMLAAAAGAASLGKWPEGAFLLFLFSLGHAGEHYALDRARHAVGALGELMPRSAHRKQGERIEEVAVDELEVDDVVVVRAGDRVPSDGTIVAGESSLDQSAITGESVPVARKVGDDVFAGTINQENALDVRVTKLARDNTLARVMRLVSEAQEQQSPTQRFAETFTRRFVPAVLILTLLVIVLPALLLHWTWADSFYRGMLLLVGASPCALAIGTPAAVLAGIAQAARHGVLIKGGAHLENLGRLETIAFDKTGTLTTGQFSLTEVVSLNGMSEDDVLGVAAAVEEQSSHPLAKAIVAAARERSVRFARASSVENLAGKGARGRVDDALVTVGARRAFEGDGTREGRLGDTIKRLEGAGQTTVIIRKDDQFVGVVGLADQARSRADAVLARLHRQGIERRVMLTGDNAAVANAVAKKVGIDEVHAELLPEKKLSVIKDLQAHGPIAMVGDGVNDAPALAAATVGIAMGGAGTAVALETADVALMGDDLGKLSFAVGLSRATQRIIKQNLIIALGVIGLLILAAMAGVIPLSIAVVFHEGSTVAVALNALRLLAWKEQE
jgi:Cd2+/Zn2+-exporting ATPase